MSAVCEFCGPVPAAVTFDDPTAVACRVCGGTGEWCDHMATEHAHRNCGACLGTGRDETLIRWTNTAARRSVVVDTETPCKDCNGGEFWECGTCLGSGWTPVPA